MKVHRLVLAHGNGCTRRQVARGLSVAAGVLRELVRDDAREVRLVLQQIALHV